MAGKTARSYVDASIWTVRWASYRTWASVDARRASHRRREGRSNTRRKATGGKNEGAAAATRAAALTPAQMARCWMPLTAASGKRSKDTRLRNEASSPETARQARELPRRSKGSNDAAWPSTALRNETAILPTGAP